MLRWMRVLLSACLLAVYVVNELGALLIQVDSKHRNRFWTEFDFDSTQGKTVDHKVIFAVKQLNLENLKDKLYAVSDPFSADYGNFLTRQEVGNMISNSYGTKATIDYLRRNQIEIVSQSVFGEYITAKATLLKWESVLQTKFRTYRHNASPNFVVFRAEEFTLDHQITPHISDVYNVIDFPVLPSSKLSLVEETMASYSHSPMTPSALNKYYNVFTNIGNVAVKQAVFAPESFSSTDLSAFQSLFKIPQHPVDSYPGSFDNPGKCNNDLTSCEETDSDLQWIMAVAQNTTTLLW